MKRHFLGALFLLHMFFMFYKLESRAPFGWDQVDNAWAAMRIITAHEFPLVGMIAKQNTGMFIGPLYYYFVAIFYFFTNMDPVASPIIAAVTSIFSFWVLYFVASRLFSTRVALVSTAIYTISNFVIGTERIQWPVNFIAPLSLLSLYFLHNIIQGRTIYFIHLGAVVGLLFHIHFTAIWYPFIILLSLPFVSRNRRMLWHLALGLTVGVLFLIPQFIYYFQHNGSQAYTSYIGTSYHGIHLRRILQLTPDAFIKFQSILMTPYGFVGQFSFLFVPVFLLVYRKILSILIALWFLVPWLVLSTYNGEISDYYFSSHTYLAIIILAYLTTRVWNIKYILFKLCICVFWAYWAFANIAAFLIPQDSSFLSNRATALEASKTARIINFTQGDPVSYLYYFYMYRKGEWLPYKL